MEVSDELKTCKGLGEREYCHEHADCESFYYCSVYDAESKCTKLRTSYETCIETEECSVDQYCWFASKDNTDKQCLPLYSMDDETRFGWHEQSSSPIENHI